MLSLFDQYSGDIEYHDGLYILLWGYLCVNLGPVGVCTPQGLGPVVMFIPKCLGPEGVHRGAYIPK